MNTIETVKAYLLKLQEKITQEVVSRDSQGQLLKDAWKKPPNEPLQGHGESRVFDKGLIFEKAGFNFSFW